MKNFLARETKRKSAFEEKRVIHRNKLTIHACRHIRSHVPGVRVSVGKRRRKGGCGRGGRRETEEKSRALKNSVNIPSVFLCLPAGNGDSTCRPKPRLRRTAQAPAALPSHRRTHPASVPASAALSQLSVRLCLLHPLSSASSAQVGHFRGKEKQRRHVGMFVRF